MRDKDTPLTLVRRWTKDDKGLYKKLDNCRAAKDEGEMDWPDYCALPIAAAYTYLVNQGLEAEAPLLAAELTACWTWRQNKVIYAFDPDLTESLCEQAEDTPDTETLPMDLLMHLPYPCVYIKAPILENMDGFWTWIEYDFDRQEPELRVQWVNKNFESSFPAMLHLTGKTIRDCMRDTMKTVAEHTSKPIEFTDTVPQSLMCAIQCVLYLLADNADITDIPRPTMVRNGPDSPKKIRDSASEITEKDVGIRIGSAIRKTFHSTLPEKRAESSPKTGTTVRPHLRRGHWHHYWYGPKNGRRILKLKWTAPTVIHAELGEYNSPVVYPVK